MALGVIMNVAPFDLTIRAEVVKTAFRLTSGREWKSVGAHTGLPAIFRGLRGMGAPDQSPQCPVFDKKYRVSLSSKAEWTISGVQLLSRNKDCGTHSFTGDLIFLKNGQDFLDAVDKEDKLVTIIIHLYIT